MSMRLFTLFEDAQGEYIPFDRSKSSAHTIGSQVARAALAKVGGSPRKAKDIADVMVKRLVSDITATVDEELGFQRQQSFDGRA